MPSDPAADVAATATSEIEVEDRSWFWCWALRGDGSCHCGAPDCDRPGKHPWWNPRTGQGFRRGHRDALTWEQAHALIGHGGTERSTVCLARATGVGAQGAVLDADGPAGIADLLRVWDAVARAGEALGAALTPRGLHLHLRPDGMSGGWPTSAGQRRLREAGLRRLEFKGRGSYVLWPGWVHSAGRRRWLSAGETAVWRERQERAWAGQLGWLREHGLAVEENSMPWSSAWSGPPPVDEVDSPVDDTGAVGVRDGRWQDPVDRLRRACWTVASADEGARNNLLNWAGWTAGRAAIAAGVARSRVEAALSEAGRRAGLEHGEIGRTVRSSLGGSEGLGASGQ